MINAERSMVSRAEIQAALTEIDRALASSAYSSALRARKRGTADLLRDRLTEGDLRTGDQIQLSVLGVPSLSGTYDVTPTRSIVVAGGLEIPVRGVLRSEIQAYLTTKLTAYVKNPFVTAKPLVRLSIFGSVGKPGFVNAPADLLLSKVITDYAGGPDNKAQFSKSQIRRNGRVVVDGAEFQDAIYKARTLDQLNVQAGDEINVATKPASALILRILGAVSGLGGLAYLIFRVF